MNKAKNILVVDDDVDYLGQVSMILEAEGYKVHPAQGQNEAEEVLLTMIPDLAVIDLMMENTDSGFVLCHRIKKLFPETPVIMLTGVKASTGLDFTARSKEASSWTQADAIIDKPVRPEQLKTEVRRLLSR